MESSEARRAVRSARRRATRSRGVSLGVVVFCDGWGVGEEEGGWDVNEGGD